jgi:hypothetical protein
MTSIKIFGENFLLFSLFSWSNYRFVGGIFGPNSSFPELCLMSEK